MSQQNQVIPNQQTEFICEISFEILAQALRESMDRQAHSPR